MSEKKMIEYKIEMIRLSVDRSTFRLHLKFDDGTRYMLAKLKRREVSVLLTKYGIEANFPSNPGVGAIWNGATKGIGKRSL